MRRLAVIFLAMLLLISLSLPAFAQEGGGKTMTMMGYEPADNYRTWEENLFFKRMQERTGITFEFRQFSDLDGYRAQLSAMTPDSAELPDVLFKARLTPAMTMELLDSGVLPIINENDSVCVDEIRVGDSAFTFHRI